VYRIYLLMAAWLKRLCENCTLRPKSGKATQIIFLCLT